MCGKDFWFSSVYLYTKLLNFYIERTIEDAFFFFFFFLQMEGSMFFDSFPFFLVSAPNLEGIPLKAVFEKDKISFLQKMPLYGKEQNSLL